MKVNTPMGIITPTSIGANTLSDDAGEFALIEGIADDDGRKIVTTINAAKAWRVREYLAQQKETT